MVQAPLSGSGRDPRALARAALALTLAAAAPSLAIDFHVTKTADTADGACDADCSLREAVIAANANPGLDRVLLGAGTYELTRAGAGEDAATTGDLDLTEDVEIFGRGAAETLIDGNRLDRAFHVNPLLGSVTAAIRDLTITDSDGGVLNWGVLDMGRCVVTANVSSWEGAGIATENGGTLYLWSSTVSENTTAQDGGGLQSNTGSLYVTGSTISDNVGGYLGGGILAQGLLALSNSTVTGNVATGGGGGGAFYSLGEVNLVHVTIASNGSAAGTADLYLGAGPVHFSNTLIADSCAFAPGVTPVSFGGNLESLGDTCGFDHATDQVAVADPGLGPLADQGGSTWTLQVFPGSPAIDQGLGASSMARDQRWAPRPFDGDESGAAQPDVGAVEVNPFWIFGDDFDSGDAYAWSWSPP